MKHVEKWKKQILWLVLSSLLLFSGCGSTQSADRSDAEVTASAGAVTQNQEEATSSDESDAKADAETDLELQSQSQSDAANASYILPGCLCKYLQGTDAHRRTGQDRNDQAFGMAYCKI